MTDSHWQPAIQTALDSNSGIYGPQSFRDYITDIGQDPRDYRTAAEISIDKKRDLASELEQNDMMVLRLGRATDGTGTQFAYSDTYIARIGNTILRVADAPSDVVEKRIRVKVTSFEPESAVGQGSYVETVGKSSYTG